MQVLGTRPNLGFSITSEDQKFSHANKIINSAYVSRHRRFIKRYTWMCVTSVPCEIKAGYKVKKLHATKWKQLKGMAEFSSPPINHHVSLSSLSLWIFISFLKVACDWFSQRFVAKRVTHVFLARNSCCSVINIDCILGFVIFRQFFSHWNYAVKYSQFVTYRIISSKRSLYSQPGSIVDASRNVNWCLEGITIIGIITVKCHTIKANFVRIY